MPQQTKDTSKVSWAKRAAGGIVFLLVAAVPALGLATLGPSSFSFRHQDDYGPLVLRADEVANGPLTFDAPTTALRTQKSREAQAAEVAPAGWSAADRKEAILLTEWKFSGSSH